MQEVVGEIPQSTVEIIRYADLTASMLYWWDTPLPSIWPGFYSRLAHFLFRRDHEYRASEIDAIVFGLLKSGNTKPEYIHSFIDSALSGKL